MSRLSSPFARLAAPWLLGLAFLLRHVLRLQAAHLRRPDPEPAPRPEVLQRPLTQIQPAGNGDSDRTPGADETDDPLFSYLIGFGLACGLTVASFGLANTDLIWGPAIPVVLMVLAVAQMGVHLVFFLHLGSGPDHMNNIMALAFGLLIVVLVLVGSLWIMSHLNGTMMPMSPRRGS
ncbi:cytochrome o ubiquinol oxidase subunit IV [Methylobacterium sp. NPDC080182]|uniref:cytochrome o ubiquinol oxidase subunit IV n=1 Tax=Methylobacterium sp. NPDC080182 TaxID=3390590 RepID=UPI003D07F492